MAIKFGTTKPQDKLLNKVPDSSVPTIAEFIPTEDQRRYKAKWWVAYNGTAYVGDPSTMTDAELAKIYPSTRVRDWLTDYNFKIWLLDDKEEQGTIQDLFNLSLGEMRDIICSRDPRFLNAKVSMIKLVSELANKMPKSGGDTYVDKQIAMMDKQQLQEFIRKNAAKATQDIKVIEGNDE